MNSPSSDYDRIIRPIEQKMMRAVWRITQDEHDADDAFQEAMIQIWRSLPRVRVHPNPSALVLRICANAACDVLRRKTRRGNRERPPSVETADISARDVASSILNDELRESITAAIASLPEQQATAITMRFLLYCSYDEVAEALECAETTARVHVSRGLGRLRDLLSHFNPSPSIESE